MIPVTSPAVAPVRKLMRVAAGRTGVGGRSGKVAVGAIVGGAIVGVAWGGCSACIVAATTVATSLGEGDGMAEFDPLQAAMAAKIARKGINAFQGTWRLWDGFIELSFDKSISH